MSKEDIEIEAALYEDACHNPSIQQHFIDGANWAKCELIEKACKWLYDQIDMGKGKSCRVFFIDTAVERLRKAMEGES
ncbi:MAG: hypothetical protein Q4A15_13000 [Prevotellaceae bacterium]|nr:hypothetical protein [Prevotellaceae bacterium]